MTNEMFLGGLVDGSGERVEGQMLFDGNDLTTHGVIVGMTGSGKTGLGVVLLEEALRGGVPTLVIDPKGDMTNLALRFPGLSAQEFAPWVPDGTDPAEVAASWSEGLASWSLGGDQIAELAQSCAVTVYTPGSSAGVGLNMIGSLAAPASHDEEVVADEIEGIVGALLSMVGIDADPLASPEHILMSNLVARAWSGGEPMALGTLVQQIQDPPIRKLGVLELDTFYPAAQRTKLAMLLNGLLASPSFAAWAEGTPLDLERMLTPDDGGVPCSVIYLAHLSEEERRFVVTLVMSKVVTWMRTRSGSPDLGALIYMDEVFGYVPPSAEPPTKKPILTVLKQARAFGVGMVLSTQNPVDLDYKALSNAGTWMIGRLQTERDVGRLEEGLANSAGDVDVAALSATIAGLAKRSFVLHSTSGSAPQTFTTRWALDYLAGPLTRDQLAELPGQPDRGAVPDPSLAPAPTTEPTTGTGRGAAPVPTPTPQEPASSASAGAEPASVPDPVTLADDEVPAPPEVADGIPVRWVDPAAPWLADLGVGAGTTSSLHVAGLAARITVLFDETKADLRHTQSFELVSIDLADPFDADSMVAADYDDRDLRDAAPQDAKYRLPDAPIHTKTWFKAATTAIKERLYRESTLTLQVNTALKAYSRPGESPEEFLARCNIAADAKADEQVAKLRSQIERKMSTVNKAIEREQVRVTELQSRASDAKRHEVISGAGDLIGSLLGGRRSTRSMLGKVKGVSSRRKASSSAEGRVDTALAKLDRKQIELEELEAELADAIADIAAEWDATAAEVEDFEVTLEKTDITVDQLCVIWVGSPR